MATGQSEAGEDDGSDDNMVSDDDDESESESEESEHEG